MIPCCRSASSYFAILFCNHEILRILCQENFLTTYFEEGTGRSEQHQKNFFFQPSSLSFLLWGQAPGQDLQGFAAFLLKLGEHLKAKEGRG